MLGLIFADDSNQHAARRVFGPVISFGGLFLEASPLRDVSGGFEAVVEDWGIRSEAEIRYLEANIAW